MSAQCAPSATQRLAADGFVVLAPEFPESLTGSFPSHQLHKLSYHSSEVEETEALGQRFLIVRAARNLLPPKTQWGIFGHAVGAVHAQAQPGHFALGRVVIAPSFGPASVHTYYRGEDPLFVISSEGDGCYKVLEGDDKAGLPLRLAGLIDRDLAPIHIFSGEFRARCDGARMRKIGRGRVVWVIGRGRLVWGCRK